MTVYNAGRHLDASVRSIVCQAFRDWEFIVVDDASTDGSAECLEDWARQERRIRVIRNSENKGQTACLNQGLGEAHGAWIARQDADDLSHPLRLSRQFEFVTAFPETGLVGTCGRMIDEGDRLCGLLDVPLSPGIIRWSFPILNPFLHTSVLFSRELVCNELGGYDEGFQIAQDYELWGRLQARRKTRNLPQRLVSYRSLAGSLSKTGKSQAFEEASRVAEREEEASFGRTLFEDERMLMRGFREGTLTGADHSKFRRTCRALYSGLEPAERSRWEAFCHLRLAGMAGSGFLERGTEMAAALLACPGYTAGWLLERVSG